MASKLSLFLSELKRRKVYHVAVVYVLVGLAVAQGADWAFDLLELPNVASQLVAVLLALGLPVALVLAWAYEVRPEEARPADPTPTAVVEAPESERRKSIVVLPFDNMSPDPGDAYFADGLTEEIITHLSYIRSLRVISRSSAMVLKGTQKDVRTIGQELDVQYVLEGSVRKAENDLRITAQLIDANNDAHVWAEKYDGILEDVFSFQEHLSESIVNALRTILSGPVPEHVATGRKDRPRVTTVPEVSASVVKPLPCTDRRAYDAYLKGKYSMRRNTDDAYLEAARWFDEAIKLDPEFAPAYVGKAEAWTFPMMGFGVLVDPDKRREAKEAIEKALALDPESSEAHTWLGAHAMAFDWDRQAADEAFSEAIRLNPNDSDALFWLSTNQVWLEGDREEGFRTLEVAEALDPFNLLVKHARGFVYYTLDDYESALGVLNSVKALEPSYAPAYYGAGASLAHMGRYREAIEQYQKCIELGGRSVHVVALLAYAHGRLGERDKALECIAELEDRSKKGLISAVALAWAYSGLKETDTVLRWLEKGFETREPSMIWQTFAPEVDFLRGDPRFADILKRMGLENLIGISTTGPGA